MPEDKGKHDLIQVNINTRFGHLPTLCRVKFDLTLKILIQSRLASNGQFQLQKDYNELVV